MFATTVDFLGNADFWITVLLSAATYGIFALGMQLNLGVTGIANFGLAGFMAVGAYGMAILVLHSGLSLWLSMILGIVLAVIAALLVGLVAVRLRSDYFAIMTLAFAEIVRLVANSWDSLTGGNLGLSGFSSDWATVQRSITDGLDSIGIESSFLLPLTLVAVAAFAVLSLVMAGMQRTAWGRLLRAIRSDENVVRALGKNSLLLKLQSLSIAAALAAIAGFILALNITTLAPPTFDPIFTVYALVIVILGGLGSFRGVVLGSVIMLLLVEGTRYLDLPMSDDRVAALRFIVIGLVLIGLIAFRPQGILGKREELQLDR
jgi:branched-chain amino acid transport system permease protein